MNQKKTSSNQGATVDGSEIPRSPVEVGSLFHYYFQGFRPISGGFLAGFEPSG